MNSGQAETLTPLIGCHSAGRSSIETSWCPSGTRSPNAASRSPVVTARRGIPGGSGLLDDAGPGDQVVPRAPPPVDQDPQLAQRQPEHDVVDDREPDPADDRGPPADLPAVR